MRDWPAKFDPKKQTLASYLGNVAELDYERARADAAIERLRVAVEALQSVPQCQFCDAHLGKVTEALAAIGPLPEEGESAKG